MAAAAKRSRKAGVPSPSQVRARRLAAGLTQTQAAELVHTTCRAWQHWESEDDGSMAHRRMHAAFWELFTLKTSVVQAELRVRCDNAACVALPGQSPRDSLGVLVTGASDEECRSKLQSVLQGVTITAIPDKEAYAQELRGYLTALAAEACPEDCHFGGNRFVSYRRLDCAQVL